MKFKIVVLAVVMSTGFIKATSIENSCILNAADFLKVAFETQLEERIFQEIINNLGSTLNGNFCICDIILACTKIEGNKVSNAHCPCCALYQPLVEQALKKQKAQNLTLMYTLAGSAIALCVIFAAIQMMK